MAYPYWHDYRNTKLISVFRDYDKYVAVDYFGGVIAISRSGDDVLKKVIAEAPEGAIIVLLHPVTCNSVIEISKPLKIIGGIGGIFKGVYINLQTGKLKIASSDVELQSLGYFGSATVLEIDGAIGRIKLDRVVVETTSTDPTTPAVRISNKDGLKVVLRQVEVRGGAGIEIYGDHVSLENCIVSRFYGYGIRVLDYSADIRIRDLHIGYDFDPASTMIEMSNVMSFVLDGIYIETTTKTIDDIRTAGGRIMYIYKGWGDVRGIHIADKSSAVQTDLSDLIIFDDVKIGRVPKYVEYFHVDTGTRTIAKTGILTTIPSHVYGVEKWGVVTLPAGSTRVTVSHGLLVKPEIVIVTPLAQPPGKIWVENITDTSFDIVTDTAPSNDLPVAWLAEV